MDPTGYTDKLILNSSNDVKDKQLKQVVIYETWHININNIIHPDVDFGIYYSCG